MSYRRRIERIAARLPAPLSALSDEELQAKMQTTWETMTGGQVSYGDVDGLIAHLVEHGEEGDDQFFSDLKRDRWTFENQNSSE
ncbi:hypothetical protein V0U79_12130 [Hyphobacterium sp. HN65]|uniref:Uncharacterized protein n=1 Tax=Hyphobacterium lacteum TaxID=3116575 RepID=A0ABU7LT66_9PROT|nr:hypothetical protein [Hyphobacterium sp. HN65]MEE2527118.1 hypothetical protein [Hyphobacterium sp. HN65]